MRRILVLAGPSAVGKTTLSDALIEKEPRFELVRSVTTRAPRGDGHDSEYIYLTKEDFLKRASRSEMLEYTEYSHNFYGTPKCEIERIFAEGRIPLLILDINGVSSIREKKLDFEVFSVYLTIDINTLENRLYNRVLFAEDKERAIEIYKQRIIQNRKELERQNEFSHLFDMVIENKDATVTAKNILSRF